MAVIGRLDATQAAQPLIAALFPFCDQVLIRVSMSKAELVAFPGNRTVLVELFVDIATPLVMDPEDGPQEFIPPLALAVRVFCLPHLLLQSFQGLFHDVPVFGELLPADSDLRHPSWLWPDLLLGPVQRPVVTPDRD